MTVFRVIVKIQVLMLALLSSKASLFRNAFSNTSAQRSSASARRCTRAAIYPITFPQYRSYIFSHSGVVIFFFVEQTLLLHGCVWHARRCHHISLVIVQHPCMAASVACVHSVDHVLKICILFKLLEVKQSSQFLLQIAAPPFCYLHHS